MDVRKWVIEKIGGLEKGRALKSLGVRRLVSALGSEACRAGMVSGERVLPWLHLGKPRAESGDKSPHSEAWGAIGRA
jgi:hypothetical protein